MLRHISSMRPFYEGDGGAPAGGNPPANDPAQAFTNLMARSSDAAALARQLFEENFRYRTELRDAQRQLPPQGAAVLTAEQAQAWAAYQQLGAPDQVQTTLQQAQQLRRDLDLRSVSDASGYKFGVLKQLAGDAAFEVRDETKDNQPVKAVYVKVDGKDIPLETYATERWADFLPALVPTAAAAGAPGAPATGATNPAAQRGATQRTQVDPKNPPKLTSIDWK